MSGGNGSDSAQMLGMLRDVLAEQRVTRADLRDLKAHVRSLDTKIDAYHQAVIGQGILASELEERVRRIERHLGIA